MSAKVTLNASPKGLFAVGLDYQAFTHYYRNVLFIRDPDHPYLVDINAASGHNYNRNNWYDMYYHGNSEDGNTILNSDQTFKSYRWSNIYESDNITRDSNGILRAPKTNKRLYILPFVVERHRKYPGVSNDKIREAYVSADPGEGVPIKRLHLSGNGPGSTGSKENFTTVALINALPEGGNLVYTATQKRPEPGTGDLEWQYLTWPNDDTTTVDVVAARSAKAYADASTGNSNLYFPVSEADSFYVELPGNLNYGFVRLTKQNEIWNVDPSFQLNLEKSELRLSASGPDCIDSGSSTGHFVASASGGKPPYSYSWSSYRICDGARGPQCNAWNNVGTTRTIDYGGYNGDNFKIRVQITDNFSPPQSVVSSEWEIRVLSSTEGSCPTDPNGKKSSDAEETLVSDAGLLEADQDIPETYALRQNFPNPFNPSTEIQFDLPEDVTVSLVVYDVLGREVARLVQEELPAGTHRARFDAGNLPSGAYFYRIQAGDFHSTQRMTLLK